MLVQSSLGRTTSEIHLYSGAALMAAYLAGVQLKTVRSCVRNEAQDILGPTGG
jgi:hypothetical protein